MITVTPGPDVACADLLPTPTACNANDGETVTSWLGRRARQQPSRAMPLSVAVRLLPTPRASDGTKGSANQHGSKGDLTLPSGNQPAAPAAAVTWGAYESAIRHWEAILGRPAPQPTETGTRGQPRLSARFVEWMMGLPAGWVTDLPLTRTAQMRLLGNGVVPQQAITAFRALDGNLPANTPGSAGRLS